MRKIVMNSLSFPRLLSVCLFRICDDVCDMGLHFICRLYVMHSIVFLSGSGSSFEMTVWCRLDSYLTG